jgi:hypothetical protein
LLAQRPVSSCCAAAVGCPSQAAARSGPAQQRANRPAAGLSPPAQQASDCAAITGETLAELPVCVAPLRLSVDLCPLLLLRVALLLPPRTVQSAAQGDTSTAATAQLAAGK